jgi:predicted ATPase/class 3 adenylate cyclase
MAIMRFDVPTGTVTFLFTDVAGSTRLLHELGPEQYAVVLAEHRRVVRAAASAHGGVEVDTQGDAFFVAFPTAPGAVAAAQAMQEALSGGPIQVRMGLHTGTPHVSRDGYAGMDVHKGARIAAVGHGGQVLLSQSTRELIDVEVRDLGLHRLKDLSAPERLFQVGEGEFPPLRSLTLTNLPAQPTPFLGRERALADVLQLARSARLLTLTGPGGSGKTRLALQAAALLAEEHEHGVWWVPLAALSDERLVLESAAQALGARGSLAEHIGGKSLLLLFDNFEHVQGAAPEVADLLATCPDLTVLATSREPLRLSAEQEYPVPPFAHAESVGFFLARARAVRPDFEADGTVDEICRRLDDLPLALELAAARVKSLSSGQILERLGERLALLTGGARDLPERQRTLSGTIAWSYDLLTDVEQRLFRRLSIFVGGCTPEAAETICAADLDTLASLVDKSLLGLGGERHVMLATIRDYAAGQLEQSGEAAETRARHAAHFLALAEQAAPELEGRNAAAALERLGPENDNFRAALSSMEGSGDPDGVLRLACALGRFWALRGQVVEGRRWLEEALTGARPAASPLRAKALYHARRLAAKQGDLTASRRFAEEEASLARELGDPQMLASALRGLGIVASNEGDGEAAAGFFEKSLAVAREAGDRRQVAMALANLGFAALERGDAVDATLLLEQGLALEKELGDEEGVAISLINLGSAAFRIGDLERAGNFLRESLEIGRRLRDLSTLLYTLNALAAVVAARDDALAAVRLLASVESLAEQSGLVLERSEQELHERTVLATREALGEEEFAGAWNEGTATDLDATIERALSLVS